MRPYRYDNRKRRIRYRAAKGVCLKCPLRSQCTDSKHGRRVERHMDQEPIEWADQCLGPRQRRHWMKRRKIVVEGSFADGANNHGFKRARWRGLKKMTIQNLLIAACQNLRKLLNRRPGTPRPAIKTRFFVAFAVGKTDPLLVPPPQRPLSLLPKRVESLLNIFFPTACV